MSYRPPKLIEAEQFVEKNRKKRRFGLVEILVGGAGVAGSLATMVMDPFAEMISTPGVEHYVGGIANGILAYGVGAIGILVAGKGLYDIVEYTFGLASARRQLEATRDEIRRENQGTRGRPSRSNGKSKILYDPDALNQLRTKKRPPFNPLLF
ncbi:MAG: hypothetical protein KAT43_04890 [Nanoarchaeota archaeon]|nr:hypothetical protein [Nanoarchaeota archaeon]